MGRCNKYLCSAQKCVNEQEHFHFGHLRSWTVSISFWTTTATEVNHWLMRTINAHVFYVWNFFWAQQLEGSNSQVFKFLLLCIRNRGLTPLHKNTQFCRRQIWPNIVYHHRSRCSEDSGVVGRCSKDSAQAPPVGENEVQIFRRLSRREAS